MFVGVLVAGNGLGVGVSVGTLVGVGVLVAGNGLGVGVLVAGNGSHSLQFECSETTVIGDCNEYPVTATV